MDLNWLQDFICLARTLNFTRAAEERNITQPAFSRRIKALEVWVGAPLIDRASFPTKLSVAGEMFLPVAKQLTLQILQARDEVRSYDSDRHRFYTFAAPHSISIHHLPSYIRAFEQSHRLIRTRVMSDNLHICCQLLSEGACDFMMCYRHRYIPLALDEQIFERLDLAIERLVPVAATAALAKGAWRLPATSASPLPYLAYAKGSFLGAVVDHILKGRGCALDVRHMDAFAEALKSLVTEGAGIAWLLESSIAAMGADGGVSILADRDDWSAELTLSLYAAPKRLDETAVEIWSFFADRADQVGA